MNDVIRQLIERKSVRAYEKRPIEAEKREAILQAAIQAPTAGNMTLYTILDITDPQKRRILSATCDHQSFIEEAPLFLIFAADYQRWFDAFQSVDADAHVPGKGDLLIACSDALIAAQNAVTAAWSLGIGSCYIGDILESCEEVRELLHLPPYVLPVTAVCFGYPTQAQKERQKPARPESRFLVQENTYRHMTLSEQAQMLRDRRQEQGQPYMPFARETEALLKRKWQAPFSAEMNRSAARMLSFWGSSEAEAVAMPPQAEKALSLLNRSGFEAYIVGGCVRDSLLGRSPGDWDITTSALPEETQSVFAEYRTIPTGIHHGTLTVLLDGMPLEITTYRVDGGYSDHRHPDKVRFTRSLREDLSRRDFTVNAMAYHPGTGLVDYFGGREDLAKGLIRCVGDPGNRLEEDALRILRALRFASALGFQIEEKTAAALFKKKALLSQVANERIAVELQKLLCGKSAAEVLRTYPAVVGEFLPELLLMVGFEQHNPHHVYDVYEHTLHAVEAAPTEPVLRLAALLHDVAKPLCYETDEEGIGHFYGHAPFGARMAEEILSRLRFDGGSIERVFTLIKYHDTQIEESAKNVKHWLNKLGEEVFRQLLRLKAADNRAQAPECLSRLFHLARLEETMDEILRERQCFSLRDLAVGGDDLLKAGMRPGKRMGEALAYLLEAVMEESCPNEKEALLQKAVQAGYLGNH